MSELTLPGQEFANILGEKMPDNIKEEVIQNFTQGLRAEEFGKILKWEDSYSDTSSDEQGRDVQVLNSEGQALAERFSQLQLSDVFRSAIMSEAKRLTVAEDISWEQVAQDANQATRIARKDLVVAYVEALKDNHFCTKDEASRTKIAELIGITLADVTQADKINSEIFFGSDRQPIKPETAHPAIKRFALESKQEDDDTEPSEEDLQKVIDDLGIKVRI